MTEAEWNTGADATAILGFLREAGRTSERKLRLFLCACCRTIWPQLGDARSRKAVEVAERFADGFATEEERRAARTRTVFVGCPDANCLAFAAIEEARRWDLDLAITAYPKEDDRPTPCRLLREIFGNPFRVIPAICPTWLTIQSLAKAAYQHRKLPSGQMEPERLAVLADALEEGGVADADLLGHLRSTEPHYRGCFVVDWRLCRG